MKEWVLNASISRGDLSESFDSILKAIDENDDGYITVRELIESIRFIKG